MAGQFDDSEITTLEGKRVPSSLFHYTSEAGLLGIVEKEALWASGAEFLNDSMELRYGAELFRRRLLARLADLDASGQYEHSAPWLRPVLEDLVTHTKTYGPESTDFVGSAKVICFSEDKDHLGQWRGYAAGAGYSIEFSASDLAASGKAWDEAATRSELDDRLRCQFIKVKYGEQECVPVIDAQIAKIEARVAAGISGDSGVHDHMRFVTYVLPFLPHFKHHAFREEREWRLLVTVEGGDLRHRTSGHGLVPFNSIPLVPTAIRGIMVGPGPNGEVRRRGVLSLLYKWLYRAGSIPPVDLSEVPFRP